MATVPLPEWVEFDRYIERLLVREDRRLRQARAESHTAGLPEIQVAPNQGKLLYLLARAAGARRILELGTLGGYSAIWLARALPEGGRLVTVEVEPRHAEIARRNFDASRLGDRVEVKVGPAADVLRSMLTAGEPPFDFVFIDADKRGYPEYLVLAHRLARVGGLIVIDNVVRAGAVADSTCPDENVRAVRRMNLVLASQPGLEATCLQTVGVKGHDGFTLVLVTAPAPAPARRARGKERRFPRAGGGRRKVAAT